MFDVKSYGDRVKMRSLRGSGMVSGVGEYTPEEFWAALDYIEELEDKLEDFKEDWSGNGY